jgi:hypothetical protein
MMAIKTVSAVDRPALVLLGGMKNIPVSPLRG